MTPARLSRPTPLLLLCLLLAAPLVADARGKGPIGLWPINERYVVLADSSLPGLVLVDLVRGRTLERLRMKKGRPIGVSSCRDCNFLLVTGGDASYWRLPLAASAVELMAENGALGLADSKLEPLKFSGDLSAPDDARIPLLHPDGDTAFVASSTDRTVYRIDLANNQLLDIFLRDSRHEPYGLNWGKDGNLLVTMHREEVWRVDSSGKKLATYNIETANCPGARRFQPILRAALDVPGPAQELFILSTNPRSYDAVIWRYRATDKPSCEVLAGSIGNDPGWLDGSGTAALFSRPHYFTYRPGADAPELLISDIDNRALRLLHTDTGQTSTIMYDRDRRLREINGKARQSTDQCSSPQKTDWISQEASTGSFCYTPLASAEEPMTLAQAREKCAAQDAQLCEPDQWQHIPVMDNTRYWSAAACASCWQKRQKSRCPATIDNYKTPGGVHKDKDFEQRWHSGQALAFRPGTATELRLECVKESPLTRAAAVCCAQ